MEVTAVFAPLIGFLLAFLFGKNMGDKGAQFVTCAAVIIAAVASVMLFSEIVLGDGDPRTIVLMPWISSGALNVDWALRVDQLAIVMMCVVNVVSACVHIYAVGYMSHDTHKARFMAYLGLFTFTMLMLVTADNLIQLFFGWEGVGLASYLLIGFWNHKDSANAAAIKAFLMNRIGDFGLALGIFATFFVFGTVQFDEIFMQVEAASETSMLFFGFEFHALTVICLLFFMGAMGKSAQLGLHTWLPDAMEGPTPVSALIHAATMVTAGVFLVARLSPLFEYAPTALMVVTLVGGATALIAATIALTQFDIKRVIAYSTMSQLGYMFFALGVSAYGAAIFHLMTHAFFKALLFLSAGSVIHAMSDEQDMRKMGGLWRKIPLTYALMWIGSLALIGMPFFAGYYSKDIILESAFADHSWFGKIAFWIGIFVAMMTAFYSARLLFMTFHGKPRASKKIMLKAHESPFIMLAPLILLAVGAIFAGVVFYDSFVGHHQIWGQSIVVLQGNDTVSAAHHVPFWVKKLPIVMGVLGLLLGALFYLYKLGLPAYFTRTFKPLHTLFFNKWFFDEVYQRFFVDVARRVGRLFAKMDKEVLDAFGPDGMAKLSQGVAKVLSKFQSGYVFQYALVTMIGLIALLSWFFIQTMFGFGKFGG